MKKNVIMRIAAVVLMCTLVTACFASSTFAKYTSATAADTNTARVAKWDIVYDAASKNIQVAKATPAVVDFDLFSTTTFVDQKDGNTETDVKQSGDTLVIAPGTKGSFAIDKITNNSEVTAHIDVLVTAVANASNIPVKFYSDAALTKEITIAANTKLLDKDVAAGASTDLTTIYWVWDFDDNGAGTPDASDTALGIAAQTSAPTYVVTLKLVATQVD